MHRADRQFRPILLGLAAVYLVAAVIVGLHPTGGSRFAGLALVAILVGALAAMVLLIWRIRAYSRTGILWFTGSVAAFSIWNAAVVGASTATGWWGPHQSGLHFSLSAVVAVIPLIAAAAAIGRQH